MTHPFSGGPEGRALPHHRRDPARPSGPLLNGCLAALVLVVPGLCAADVRLTAGAAALSFPSQPSGRFGVAVSTAVTPDYVQDRPAVVVISGGPTTADGYDRVTAGPSNVTATAAVTTPAGSRFAFTDTWTATGDAFRLSRQVAVVTVGRGDDGFDTRFVLRPRVPGPRPDFDLFMPGVWYRQNEHVVPHAIGADPAVDTYLTKETRLALPLAMVRPKAGGPSVTIVHVNAHPATTLNDADPRPQTNAGIQYGSIGPCVDGGTFAVGFCYPRHRGGHGPTAAATRPAIATTRSALACRTLTTCSSARAPRGGRFPGRHDRRLAGGVRHVRAGRPAGPRRPRFTTTGWPCSTSTTGTTFPAAGAGCRSWCGSACTPRAAGTTCRPIRRRAGGISDYHMQSGFVGQQMFAAYLMARDGLRNHRPDEVRHGSAMIDFWVAHSLSPAGVPRTDYFAEGAHWDDGPVFLRTVSDATEGILDGGRVTVAAGHPHPAWLAYARHVGDWLIAHQAADGSWPRSLNVDDTVANPGQFNTTNPLRMLVELHAATGDRRYLDAALRAGQWCLTNIDAPATYVGGTPDNDNTIDKEAGVLALYGFQALYDATGEPKWLTAAARAADYAETWTYAWTFNVAPGRGTGVARSPWPTCGVAGQSLVATGHSYADMFMAFCSTAYYRLSIATGDAHYRDVARLLADGANRPADVTGALNYPRPRRDRGGAPPWPTSPPTASARA